MEWLLLAREPSAWPTARFGGGWQTGRRRRRCHCHRHSRHHSRHLHRYHHCRHDHHHRRRRRRRHRLPCFRRRDHWSQPCCRGGDRSSRFRRPCATRCPQAAQPPSHAFVAAEHPSGRRRHSERAPRDHHHYLRGSLRSQKRTAAVCGETASRRRRGHRPPGAAAAAAAGVAATATATTGRTRGGTPAATRTHDWSTTTTDPCTHRRRGVGTNITKGGHRPWGRGREQDRGGERRYRLAPTTTCDKDAGRQMQVQQHYSPPTRRGRPTTPLGPQSPAD